VQINERFGRGAEAGGRPRRWLGRSDRERGTTSPLDPHFSLGAIEKDKELTLADRLFFRARPAAFLTERSACSLASCSESV
jgi:hypothetical protein